jgi:electron transport complex protein RnfE
MAKNAIGMGIAATIVLMCSNVVISLLKKAIPDKVRIPCYIVVVAGFVTMVQLLVKAYAPDIDKALGIFLPLIVVNCIILGRAEMFANKSSVLDSLLDGIGMGIGFTLALIAMGTIREILGSGSWMGIDIFGSIPPIAIFKLAPGGFFVFGALIALVNKLTKGKKVRTEMGCGGCPAAAGCPNAPKGGC